ncbi:MAG TPA: hypothetical protein VK272_08285 [Solirubrobacteraceae bacterium]|nr:hypothetical protein [Solirubrobacteraceae bacterium]
MLAVLTLGAIAATSASGATYESCQQVKGTGAWANSTCTQHAEANGKQTHNGDWEIRPVSTCIVSKAGEYVNSTCTVKSAQPGKGKFEKEPTVPFTATTGVTKIATPAFGAGQLECATSAATGEITGPKTDIERVTFTGCTLEGKQCESTAAFGNGTPSGTAGVIITNLLASKLVGHGEKAGGFKHQEPLVGEVWDELISAEHQPYLDEFICGSQILLRPHGSVSGVIAPINVLSTSSTTTLALGQGEQALLTEVFTGTEFVPPGGAESTETTQATGKTAAPVKVNTENREEPEPEPETAQEREEREAREAKEEKEARENEEKEEQKEKEQEEQEELEEALKERGSVNGTITDTVSPSHPVAGALVSVCARRCYAGATASDGSYEVSGVPDGTYAVSVSPPSGSPDDTATSPQFAVTGTATTTENLTLTSPVPLPGGTVVSGNGKTDVGGVEVPVIYWGSESPITTMACIGGTVTVTITAVNSQTEVLETTPPVTLTENPAGSGSFSGRLPAVHPIHGQGTVTITVTGCPEPIQDKTESFTIYIDPSGTVVDGNNGDAPLPGATVTLLASETRTGVFAPVANGSAVMSPANRVNPDTSNATGGFGWDAVPGFYEVQATEAGCGTVTTRAFRIPPPVSDLQLVLHCVKGLQVETRTLPDATRGVAYSTQLVASGGSAPYKWKKASALPKGLKLSKAGVLSGTPSTKLSAGAYQIKVKVTDSAKKSVSVTRTLNIQ